MANNYTQMSEVLDGIPEDGIAWAKELLGRDYDDDSWDRRRLGEDLGLDLEEEKIFDMLDEFPGFEYEVREGSIWFYSEEGMNTDHLAIFVQRLLELFIPKEIFTCTMSHSCSKLRIGEFGGGWLAVSRDRVAMGNTWDSAEEQVKLIEQGRKEGESE